MADFILNPAHYTVYPVQPIQITRHLGFCLGNAVKYVLRAPYKGGVEDCDKALRYLELERQTPMRPLSPAEFKKVMEAARSLVEWLEEAPGDQLWRDIAEWQYRFVWEVINYIFFLQTPCDLGHYFLVLEKYARELGRVLSLRDTTGQIYEGMSGLPQKEAAQ